MGTFQKLITKFKHHLKNYNYTPFVKDFFFISNIRSSIYVSAIVAIIEIWLLIMLVYSALYLKGKVSNKRVAKIKDGTYTLETKVA